MPSSRPELEALTLGGTAEPWVRFGLDVDRPVGGVHLRFEGGEPGINGWVLGTPAAADGPQHPNGITGFDHVVLVTRDLEAKVTELIADGFDHRATRGKQAFFVLGPCLLELVEADGEGLWGITFVGSDLDRFGGMPKDAVQPGRRIVTVPHEAGLGFPVAVLTPR